MSDILSHITDCIQYRKKKVKSVGQKNITLFMSGGGGIILKQTRDFLLTTLGLNCLLFVLKRKQSFNQETNEP